MQNMTVKSRFGGGAACTLASQLEKGLKMMYNSNERNYTMGRRFGFTLAEVLITLAIIGVVAALTIPTLVNNYQEKVTVNKVLSAYSIINNAYQLAKIDNGDFTSWFSSNSTYTRDKDNNIIFNNNMKENMDIFFDVLSPYLKTSSICRSDDKNCEKYDALYNLSGERRNSDYSHLGIMNLMNGMTIIAPFIAITGYGGASTVYGDFAVDINGILPPNTIGKDIFYFYFTNDAVIPSGTDATPTTFYNECKPNSSGYGCTAWLIQNKNLDYLKCFEDLSWDGKHKCGD